MATNLGTLTLNLLANTGSYTQGLQRAERQTHASTESMAKDFDLVGRSVNALKGVVAGISVAGITAFALDVVNAGNEVNKFAKVANAPVEQFQYISKGAQVAGYSLEQFAMINKDVLDRLGEANRGEGEMMDFFTNIAPRIGVTIDQFKNLSGPEVLQKYYDGLEKANLSHPEMITYMEQIADDASLLIPMLKNGGAGFEYWGEKAKEAGAIMSDDMVQDMVAAKENLQVLDLQWQGFKSTLVNDAMPVLNTVVQNMDAVVTGAGILSVVVGSRLATSYAKASIEALANTVATRNKAVADYDLAKAELASTAAMVKSMGVINAETTALVANARAKYQSAAASREAAVASSTMATVGRGALALAGGWVGLGITVASVAAGYLMLRDNGNETNKMLENQSRYAGMATEELKKLSGAQKRAAEKELSTEIMVQSGHLQKAKNDFEALTESVLDSNKGNKDAYRIWAELRAGVISTDEAFNKLNQSDFVTPAQINALIDSKKKVDEHNTALSKANSELSQIRTNGANAAWGIDALGNAADRASNKLANLSAKQIEYINQVKSDALEQQYIQDRILQGYSRERAEHMAAERKSAGMGFSAKDGPMPEAVRQAEAQAWAIKQSEKLREEANRKSEESAKKREADRQKIFEDAKTLQEKQYQDRESIYYRYATREMKIEKDLQNEILKIRKANFSPKDTAGYIQNAQMRSGLEIQLYQAQLDAELKDWKSTEQEKLNQKVYINELMIQLDADMNDKQKKDAMRSLIDRSNQELAWMKLDQAQRISDASQAFQTDMQNMTAKYEFERQQIILNKSLSKTDRDVLINASYRTQDLDNEKSRHQVWGNYQDAIGLDTSADRNWEQRGEAIKAAYDWQLITQEEYQNRMLESERQYYFDKAMLQVGYGQQIVGSTASMFKAMFGEQSKAYTAMFALEKGFAVGQAALALAENVAQASKVGFPYNLPFIAGAFAQGAAITSIIASAAEPSTQGFATGGHITGKGTGTSDDIPIWASNGEFMIRAAAVEKLGLANLDYINRTGMLPPRFATGGMIGKEKYIAQPSRSDQSGGVNVVINVPAGYTANESRDSSGNVTIDVVKQVVKQAFGNLNQSNSFESKQIKNNFNVGRAR